MSEDVCLGNFDPFISGLSKWREVTARVIRRQSLQMAFCLYICSKVTPKPCQYLGYCYLIPSLGEASVERGRGIKRYRRHLERNLSNIIIDDPIISLTRGRASRRH